MPLTPLQRRIFQVIRENRSPDSFVYGALTLHADDQSPRYSSDVDIAHDVAECVARSAETDAASLISADFEIRWILRQPTFQRAEVALNSDSVVLEWVYDSAFRFFPVEKDPEFGYRLHPFDIATNKMLALAGRAEARDFVDAVYLHDDYLSLGTLAWAAAGKDEGLNPLMILELAERFAHYRQDDIDALSLAVPLNIATLSEKWRWAMTEGKKLVSELPAKHVGCAFLDIKDQPIDPSPESPEFAGLKRHFGSVGGAWPRIVDAGD